VTSQLVLGRREVVLFSAFLVLMGAGWGATQPLTKIAVSTGYGPYGLLVWQQVLGAALMGLVCLVRATSLPLHGWETSSSPRAVCWGFAFG